jgi:hypothetical protein
MQEEDCRAAAPQDRIILTERCGGEENPKREKNNSPNNRKAATGGPIQGFTGKDRTQCIEYNKLAEFRDFRWQSK